LLSIFSVEEREKSPVKIFLKSTRGVHFTILPASPCAAEFYEIWHMRSTDRRNHMCQIFNQSGNLWHLRRMSLFNQMMLAAFMSVF